MIACGFISAGLVLGRDADSASRRAPLREVFDWHITRDQFQLFANVEGRLRTDATKGPSGVTLSIAVDRIDVNGTPYATAGGALIGVGGELASDQILQWRTGRRVALPATLRTPTTYLDTGVGDAERQMAWRGVALVGSVKSERLVEVTTEGGPLAEILASTRAAIRQAVVSSVGPWSAQSAAVVDAILIGDRAGLEPDVERRLQEAGTYHVIAISGGNIAILAGLSLFLLRLIGCGPRSAALCVIAMLVAYAFIVEGGSSVARATLMAVVYFSAQLIDHRTPPLNVAALTAAILFCADPLQVVDPGFALTFGATLGILVGMSKLAHVLPASRWMRGPLALLIASASAEIALLPISAFVFSRVTFAGLIVNFAAIPLMTIVQIAGMAAVALTGLSGELAGAAGWFAHVAVEGLIGSAGFVDAVPWLTRRLAPPPLWVMAVYYAAFISFVVPTFRSAGRRAAAACAMAAGIWIITTPTFALFGASPAPLRVTFLDVGQGDAAIVQFPDGRTLSIDAGGLASTTFDIGGRVIAPSFWALGVRRIDYMSVTHGDVDHIGGAASLFRDFKPFEVWEGVPVPPHLATRELRALADEAGTVWRTLQPADRVNFGQVELVVHHPPHPDWERQRVRNDDSEVLEIRYGGVSFVFTGDIGRDVERAIAPNFARAPIRVLKVPHHGSATSSSQVFLDALRPDVAVISAGRGNPFGHPVPSVVERYRNIGAAIYRTDQDGAVTVETDGTTVRVAAFTGRRLTLRKHGR
ncbi:MAG TPA: DNA internalization-related competence protein ComEC/Rec2 [Vicinamibacterales bacterium]|nr:DNA internalization-related competence protein ComEC/Rec2 [Vicinamibacterales bacterium]